MCVMDRTGIAVAFRSKGEGKQADRPIRPALALIPGDEEDTVPAIGCCVQDGWHGARQPGVGLSDRVVQGRAGIMTIVAQVWTCSASGNVFGKIFLPRADRTILPYQMSGFEGSHRYSRMQCGPRLGQKEDIPSTRWAVEPSRRPRRTSTGHSREHRCPYWPAERPWTERNSFPKTLPDAEIRYWLSRGK